MQKKRVITASTWVLGGYLISQLVRLGSNLVLTRLLFPEMFGVMAIVTTINTGVSLCTDIGLKQNIIRLKKGLEPEYLNTAWTIKVIRGALLWAVILLISHGISWWDSNVGDLKNTVYGYPELPDILLVTGLNAFITGFGSTKIWLAQRNLQLKRLTVLELGSQVIGIAVMVFWAFYYKTIWGLVLGNLTGTIITACFSHILLKGENNRFYLDGAIAWEFLHFGKWLFASAIITFFALHGDRVILGKFLSADKLGVYSIAFFLADSVNTVLGKLGDGVFYPILSETWRNNRNTLKRKYYKIRLVQDTLVLLIAGFLYSSAPLIIKILYDDRYQDAGWMLQILSISLIGSNYTLGSKLLTILGYPYIRTVIVSARAILLWTTVPLALHLYGIQGGLYAISGNVAIEIVILIIALYKYNMLSLYREFILLPIVLAGYALGEGFNRFYYYLLQTIDFHNLYLFLQKQANLI